jgi:hypothetical protein
MEVPALYQLVSSGVCRISSQIGDYVASGSGFLVDNKIVTCGHVYYDFPENSVIDISFPDGYAVQVPKYVIDGSVKALSDSKAYDFCAIDLAIDFSSKFQFRFSDLAPVIGETVCALGYPFGQRYLTIHNGIISASYRSGVAEMLQLDMSINPANSGGPLINSRGEVIGLVCRKATGLTTMFDELIASFEQNKKVLSALTQGGSITLMGLDPVQFGIASQTQMQLIAKEIARSANVGIGYSISTVQLAQEGCFSPDAHSTTPPSPPTR